MENFNKIILLLGCTFDVYIYYDFFCAYFDFRKCFQQAWRRLVICIMAVAGMFLINSIGMSHINLLGCASVNWIALLVVFKAKNSLRILYFLIALFVVVGCEFLFGILLSLPMFIQKQNCFVNLSDIPWHMFTMKLLTYILMSIIKQFFGNSKKSMSIKLFINYLFIPIANFTIMIFTYYTSFDVAVSQNTKVLLCSSFVLMLLGNILIFRAFNKYSEELYMNTEQQLIISRQRMDLDYYTQVQRLDNRHQTFIHDISHHLRAIGELAREKKTDSILSIIHDLNIELENNALTIYCENPVVNSILSAKKSIAEKHNIDMDIYVEPGVKLNKISDADVVTMLSNLLDNALRAVENADKKVLTVRMYIENGGCFNIVKIENYFKGEIIKNEEGFETTKNEDGIHGLGIKSVENTAQKYNGYLECFDKENLFTAVLVLPVL